jgi:hypothetical protein
MKTSSKQGFYLKETAYVEFFAGVLRLFFQNRSF